MTRVTEKVPLSRHQNVHLSKPKAIIIAAAGALSVATAASVTAMTWSPETLGSAREPANPGLSVTAQIAQPPNVAAQPRNVAAQPLNVAARPADVGQLTAQLTAAKAAARPSSQRTDAVTLAFRGTPQQIAKAMLRSFGWSSGQFVCLGPLWAHESGWSVTAYNAGSGAYGIPQALPGSKMASAGPNWQTSAVTQIRWGLRYIKGLYRSPCGAWAHEQAAGWY